MSQTLEEGKPMEITRFIKMLSKELSQTTANLLSSTLLGTNSNIQRYINIEKNPIFENYNKNYLEWQEYDYGQNCSSFWYGNRENNCEYGFYNNFTQYCVKSANAGEVKYWNGGGLNECIVENGQDLYAGQWQNVRR